MCKNFPVNVRIPSTFRWEILFQRLIIARIIIITTFTNLKRPPPIVKNFCLRPRRTIFHSPSAPPVVVLSVPICLIMLRFKISTQSFMTKIIPWAVQERWKIPRVRRDTVLSKACLYKIWRRIPQFTKGARLGTVSHIFAATVRSMAPQRRKQSSYQRNRAIDIHEEYLCRNEICAETRRMTFRMLVVLAQILVLRLALFCASSFVAWHQQIVQIGPSCALGEGWCTKLLTVLDCDHKRRQLMNQWRTSSTFLKLLDLVNFRGGGRGGSRGDTQRWLLFHVHCRLHSPFFCAAKENGRLTGLEILIYLSS